MKPQNRGVSLTTRHLWNTRGCRVTRHHSRKSGRVSFVREALPKVQNLSQQLTTTTPGPSASKNNGHLGPYINTHKIHQLYTIVQELINYSLPNIYQNLEFQYMLYKITTKATIRLSSKTRPLVSVVLLHTPCT